MHRTGAPSGCRRFGYWRPDRQGAKAGWSHEVIHAAGAQATRIAQALEVIDDRAQERQILRQIGAEIMRMPPKVKDATFGRGGVDGALDSLQPAVVERCEPAR